MPKPFSGKIELDVRDSTADWLCIGYDSGDAVTSMYTPKFFTGGTIQKVVFDIADDAYVDVEAHLAAAMARD